MEDTPVTCLYSFPTFSMGNPMKCGCLMLMFTRVCGEVRSHTHAFNMHDFTTCNVRGCNTLLQEKYKFFVHGK